MKRRLRLFQSNNVGASVSSGPIWAIDATTADSLVNANTKGPALTVTRADTNGWGVNSSGNLRQFASNQILRTYDPQTLAIQGFPIRETRTNVVLWNRDLTNAAWTKGATATVAKDQTGADGVSNSASSFTGGAVTMTNVVTQSITLGSSARFQSALVKRLVGTGTIEMTMDGGTTWVNITSQVDGAANGPNSFRHCTIPTQTIANPNVGFRITTSGDKIAVDFVQNENGTFFPWHGWIATTTASATRAAEVATVATSSITGYTDAAMTLYAKYIAGGSATSKRDVLSVSDGTTSNVNEINMNSSNGFAGQTTVSGSAQANVNGSTATAGSTFKQAYAATANDFIHYVGGAQVGTPDVSGSMPTNTTVTLGRGGTGAFSNVPISEARLYNARLAVGTLATLTT